MHVAQEARRVFAEGDNDSRSRRERPPALVAASIGSYGAYRADGSEYRHARMHERLESSYWCWNLFAYYRRSSLLRMHAVGIMGNR